MKKKIYIILLGILIPMIVYTQSSFQNYIQTRTYTNDSSTIYLDAIQYFDGLGRPVQSVQKSITPSQDDLISLLQYDSFGREDKLWLPAVFTDNNGAYVDTDAIINGSQITNTNGGISDLKPYSQPIYEASPLNRILEQYAPGQDWHNNKKAIRTTYLTNIEGVDTLNCVYYKITEVSATDTLLTINRNGNYHTGQLYVTRMTDEDGNTSFEFKDKMGQVIVARQLVKDGQAKNLYDTYYIYDELGNLQAVLPPLASNDMKTASSWTNSTSKLIRNYAYLYKYDHRNRCTAKRLPGTDWISYVYDKADRLIYTQDGEQRLKGEWTFTIPDANGRIALTGITTETIDVNNKVVKAVFSQNGSYKGYNIQINGMVNNFVSIPVILSVNYYDNYDFRAMAGIPANKTAYYALDGYGKWYTGTDGYHAKGLLTGAITAQFLPDGTVSPDYLYSVMYYDNKGQLIQTRSNNHLGGIETEYIAYNFTGQPLKKKHVHNNGENTITEKYTYQYDHAGRLYNTKHRLNNQPQTYLLQNRYDELGRLVKQGIGQQVGAQPKQQSPAIMPMAAVRPPLDPGGPIIKDPFPPIITEPIPIFFEKIGTLDVNDTLYHTTAISANRKYTPNLEFTLQEMAWVTIEYPYSSQLGETNVTFFSYSNGKKSDILYQYEANMSTPTTRKVRYRLGVGTHTFNIYNPATEYQSNPGVFTTITLTTSSVTDPEEDAKTPEFMGALSGNDKLSYSTTLSTCRTLTPDLQFTLEQDAWVTIEYPRLLNLGKTTITFFSKLNGVTIDNMFILHEDVSVPLLNREKFYLEAGTHYFNIYDPLATIASNSNVPTTITLSSSQTKDDLTFPTKDIIILGSLDLDGSLARSATVYANALYTPNFSLKLKNDAFVTIQYPSIDILEETKVQFSRLNNDNIEYEPENKKLNGIPYRQVEIELSAGSYLFCIYNPEGSGKDRSANALIQIDVSASLYAGGGDNPGDEDEDEDDDDPEIPAPIHPTEFTVAPLQVVEYEYNVRSWTKAITSPLFSQRLYYNEQYGGSTPQYNGNISAMEWQVDGENYTRGYAFAYDNLSRLTRAAYLQNGTANDNYRTAYSYDKHGNMLTTLRHGKATATAYGIVDNLAMTYNGNQLVKVNDSGENISINNSSDFKDHTNGNGQYTYNRNGAMNKDSHKGISHIKYNSLNLPMSIEVDAPGIKGRTKYVYSASGVKLRVIHETDMNPQVATIMATSPFSAEIDNLKVTDYAGNKIYENGQLKRVLVDGGYIEDGIYHFYLTDHLGNNRVVINQNDSIVQRNHYYPFGMEFADNSGDDQPYKYNGKELDMMHGLNMYDYVARQLALDVPRFTSVDPLAEKYYSWSPYSYVGNNPIKRIDPTGMDWYEDEEGNAMWKRSSDKSFEDKNGKKWKNIGTEYLIADKDLAILFKQRINEDGKLGLYSISLDMNSDNFYTENSSLERDREAVRGMQSTDASRSAQQEFWDNPTTKNWIKYCFTEVLGQYTDPYRVVGGLSAGVAGYSTIARPLRSARSSTREISHQYAPRVRARGVQDPVSHNFPYSFDDQILSTIPKTFSNGYQIFELRGSMNGKVGFFEIGRRKGGIIDHRFFRPD